jgi:hypothetical protein
MVIFIRPAEPEEPLKVFASVPETVMLALPLAETVPVAVVASLPLTLAVPSTDPLLKSRSKDILYLSRRRDGY